MKRLAAALALAVVAGAWLPAPALAQDKVSFRLNWVLIGQHPPFFLGKERGYYAEERIDLSINEGRGSGSTVTLVANGDDHFGLADTGSVIAGRAKGAPVAVIMSVFGISNLGIICRADAGVGTLKDLIGKKVAVTAGDALHQMWPALLAANKIGKDQITLVFMDPAAKPIATMDRKTDCLLGGIDDQSVIIENKGVPVKVLRFADFGVDTLSVSVLTTVNMIRTNPDLVRRFVRATTRSWKAAIADPAAAVEAAAKTKPGVSKEILLGQLRTGITLIESPHNKGKAFGWAPPALWEQTLDIMKTYRELKTDVPVTDHYNYSFLAN
jgi:NitT/TauT family transport system substrate-binding protein